MDLSSLGTTEWLVLAGVVVLLVIIVLIVVMARRRRRASLQDRYGPEYERTVRAAGGDRAARHDLADREREHERLRLRDLDAREREDFGRRMARLQYRFAEDPAGAVYEAGRVAADALMARGYPISEDRDRALGLLAVDHPQQAQPLRTAIEGTYGKDQGRLRETFIAVRDSLREILGIHYGVDDGTAASPAPSALETGGAPVRRDEPDAEDRSPVRDHDEGSRAGRGDHVDGDHERTVRLDGGEQAADRPVGAVPPPPGDRSGSSPSPS